MTSSCTLGTLSGQHWARVVGSDGKCRQSYLSAGAGLCTCPCRPTATTKRNGVCPGGCWLAHGHVISGGQRSSIRLPACPEHAALATAILAVYLHCCFLDQHLSETALGTSLSFSFPRSCIYKWTIRTELGQWITLAAWKWGKACPKPTHSLCLTLDCISWHTVNAPAHRFWMLPIQSNSQWSEEWKEGQSWSPNSARAWTEGNRTQKLNRKKQHF